MSEVVHDRDKGVFVRFGSDLMVEHLAKLGLDLVTLNPGASIRGLHDSLVRAGGAPDMVLALHEEIAVGMAHGYAKAAGKPAAVFVHDLVGLQHASMAIFNAWADSVPMLIIGGSGPRDSAQRRPWIDWVHTGLPQGSLVRDYVKWDDEPGSLAAASDSLTRAMEIATRGPQGPVYVSIDVGLQECSADGVVFPDPPRVQPSTVAAPRATAEGVTEALARARRPVAIVDLPHRGLGAALLRLVEATGTRVVDLGGGANFPTEHWANHTHRRREVMAEADLVIALDVRDLLWSIAVTDERTRTVTPLVDPDVPLISVSLTDLQIRGFVTARSYVAAAQNVIGDPVQLIEDVTALLESGDRADGDASAAVTSSAAIARAEAWETARGHATDSVIHPAHLAAAAWDAVSDGPWQLANRPIGTWVQRLWNFSEEHHFLGLSGGQGFGYGLPASLGAAYAQRSSDTLVVNIQGDGDLMYTSSALWTAARYRLPLLTVVNNNRSYGKDELHQREVARTRGRSEDVVGVGIDLSDPDISFVKLAESQGVEGIGPVEDPGQLPDVLRTAARIVRAERRPVLVDVLCPLGAEGKK
jgi:benzoylformate decarboxylase/acetolactate synthase-1/2/3 large subunit